MKYCHGIHLLVRYSLHSKEKLASNKHYIETILLYNLHSYNVRAQRKGSCLFRYLGGKNGLLIQRNPIFPIPNVLRIYTFMFSYSCTNIKMRLGFHTAKLTGHYS